MQKNTLVAAFAALATLAASSATAASGPIRAQAKLVTAVSAPKDVVVNGLAWHCEGDSCVGAIDRVANLDSPMRECKRAAAELGAFATYVTRGRDFSEGSLKVCNSAVAAKAGESAPAQK